MYRIFFSALAACVSAGCSLHIQAAKSGSRPQPPGLIRLMVQADPQLNRYEKTSHALLVCLYQLREPEGFRQLAQEKDGMPKLLECGRFDASVVNARQIVVQPGQELKQICDKGDGARYVALATGYYSLGNKKVTELFQLPAQGDDAAWQSLLHVDLGPQEIRNARVE